AADLSGRGHPRPLVHGAPTGGGPAGPGPRRAAAHHRSAGRAGRGLRPGGVRRHLRHAPPGMPAPDLLQPRRHSPPGDGAAAHQAGLEIGSEELPDHLPVVLEFGAAHDPERGAKILRSNRPGVELLRLHLADIASPWHGALVALCATLPPLDADDRAAVLKLAEE